jgi:hypothetical protein
VVETPLRVMNGANEISDRPGSGFVWNDEAVERCRLG